MELLSEQQSEKFQGSVDIRDPVATTLEIASGEQRTIHAVLDGLQKTYYAEETREVVGGKLHGCAYVNRCETPGNEEGVAEDSVGRDDDVNESRQGPSNLCPRPEMHTTPHTKINGTRKPIFCQSSKDAGTLEDFSLLTPLSASSSPSAIENEDGDSFSKFPYTNPLFLGGASNASKVSDEGGVPPGDCSETCLIHVEQTRGLSEPSEVPAVMSNRPHEQKHNQSCPGKRATNGCTSTGSIEAIAEESVRRTVSEDCSGQRDADLHESLLLDAAMLNRTISDPIERETGIRSLESSEAGQSRESVINLTWSSTKEFKTDFVVRHLEDDFLPLDHTELGLDNEGEAQSTCSQLSNTFVKEDRAPNLNPLTEDTEVVRVCEENEVDSVSPSFEGKDKDVSAPLCLDKTGGGRGDNENAVHSVDRSAEISRESEKGKFLAAMFARRKISGRESVDSSIKSRNEPSPPQQLPSYSSPAASRPDQRPSHSDACVQPSPPNQEYAIPRHGYPKLETAGRYGQLRDDLVPLAWSPQEGKFFMNKRANTGTVSILNQPSWNPSTSCVQTNQAPLEWDPTNYPYECDYEQYLRNGDMGMSPFSPVRSGSPADYEEARMVDRLSRIQQAREEKRTMSRSRDGLGFSPSGDFPKMKWKRTHQSQDLPSPAHPFQCDSEIIMSSLELRERKTKTHDAVVRWDAADVAKKRAVLECSLRAHSSVQLETLPKPFNKKNLPYSPSARRALQDSLSSWTASLGLIKEDHSKQGFASVLDGLRKGTLLCSLARILTSKSLSGVCRNPLSQSSRAANIMKACKVFRGVRGMSWRYLNYQEDLIEGSSWALTGLLEDIHRLYHGLPPRSSVVCEGDQPYIPNTPNHPNLDEAIQHHELCEVRKKHLKDNVGATEPDSKRIAQERLASLSRHSPYSANRKGQQAFLKKEEDYEIGSCLSSTKHQCGCAMRRTHLELCEWLARKGINVHWQTPLEEACKDGTLLCKLLCTLEKCSLPGVQEQPRSNAAAAFNLSKALGILRKTPKMPLRYLWKEKDLLEGKEGVAVGLLKDVRRAYKHEDNHRRPMGGYVWRK